MLRHVNRDYAFYSIMIFIITTICAGLCFDGGHQGLGWSLALLSFLNVIGWFLYIVFVPPMMYRGSED